MFLIYSMRVTRPAHLSLLDFITLTVSSGEYYLRRSSFFTVVQLVVIHALWGPKVLHRTLFSKPLNAFCFFTVTIQVSRMCKTSGKIIDL